MKTTIINTGTVAEFFEHGREIAKLIDQSLPLPEESTISFEDPSDINELAKLGIVTLSMENRAPINRING